MATGIFNNSPDKRIYIAPQETFNVRADIEQTQTYMLDATQDATVTYSTKVTSFYVNNRSDTSDHVKNNPRVVNFNGVVSNDLGIADFVKEVATGSGTSLSEPATIYQANIERAIAEKQVFTVSIPNIPPIANCVIERASFHTNKNLHNSFRVSMTLKEIQVPESATGLASVEERDVLAGEQTAAPSPTQKVIPEGQEIPDSNLDSPTGTNTLTFNNSLSAPSTNTIQSGLEVLPFLIVGG